MAPEGRIYVSDLFAGSPGFGGAVFEVERPTGRRRLVSNFGEEPLAAPISYGLDVDRERRVIVTWDTSALVRIRPRSGEREIVTDFKVPQQPGETPRFVNDLAMEARGTLVVTTSAIRTIRNQGPAIRALTYLALLPR